MSFKKIVESSQKAEENEGFLVLIRCGVFFVGIGKDAVILSERLGLTNVCFAEGICKCGIPVNKIDKMLAKIISKKISVVIYDYNPRGIARNKGEKYELLRRVVMSPLEETRKCMECEKCLYYSKRIKSNVTSTEEIIKEIDNILEKTCDIIDIDKENENYKVKDE